MIQILWRRHKMERPLIVAVTGPDGTPRTALIQNLLNTFALDGRYKAVHCAIWDVLFDASLGSLLKFRSPNEADDSLKTLSNTPRAMLIFACFLQSLELAKKNNPDVILANGYWYKYFAAECIHGTERKELEMLSSLFPKPEITYFMDISIEDAYKRKSRITSYESGYGPSKSFEFFKEFQKGVHDVFNELRKGSGWIELDTRQDMKKLSGLMFTDITDNMAAR